MLFITISLSLSCEKEDYLEGNWTFTECNIAIPSDTYNYPLTQDSRDWGDYTISEIWQIDQLPRKTIYHISTVGLIETCLTFPFYVDIALADYHQNAFDYMVNNFNGLHELLKRNASARLIYERYKFMTPSCNLNNWPSLIGRGESIGMSFIAIEIILAQYSILEKFNSFQLSEILNESFNKYTQKLTYEHTKSIWNIKFTLAICGRILKINNYEPFNKELEDNNYLNHFINTFDLNGNLESLDIIIFHTENFLRSI